MRNVYSIDMFDARTKTDAFYYKQSPLFSFYFPKEMDIVIVILRVQGPSNDSF